MKNPTHSSRATGMTKPSHVHTRKSTLKIEDAVMILSIGVVIVYVITEACR